MKVQTFFWSLLALAYLDSCDAGTVRYRKGRLRNDENRKLLSIQDKTSVTAARKYCQREEKCVSFGFESSYTRFPGGDAITAYFYPYADWHVLADGEAAFVDSPSWHLYVNITREQSAVSRETSVVFDQLALIGSTTKPTTETEDEDTEKSSLRSRRKQEANTMIKYIENVEAKLNLLNLLYNIAFPQELKAIAAPHLVTKLIEICSNDAESDEIRVSTMTILVVIADSEDTAQLLIASGIYPKMKQIIESRSNINPRSATPYGWDGVRTMALNIISNIALHRTANDQLRKAGAPKFLRDIVSSEVGFPSLQAAMALTHIGIDETIELPEEKLRDFVNLLESSIDGDVVYDILWDLIPGPLSAIKYIVEHSSRNKEKSSHMVETLLDEGLMEQLLRVLEVECLVASHAEAALQILSELADISMHAREMIMMATVSIKDAQKRLEEYRSPAIRANELTSTVSRHDFLWSEL